MLGAKPRPCFHIGESCRRRAQAKLNSSSKRRRKLNTSNPDSVFVYFNRSLAELMLTFFGPPPFLVVISVLTSSLSWYLLSSLPFPGRQSISAHFRYNKTLAAQWRMRSIARSRIRLRQTQTRKERKQTRALLEQKRRRRERAS